MGRRAVGRCAGAAVIMALLLVLNAGPVSSATTVSLEAVMTVTPGQGAVGSLMSLAGSGLPAHRRAGLFLGRKRLAGFRTDRRGDWTVRTRIPVAGQIGTPSLRVVIARRQVIGARFPVTATTASGASASALGVLSSGEQVGLSSTRTTAGSSVGLIGSGFKHRGVVQVWLDGNRLATARASRSGALRSSVRIPHAIRPRGHTLSLRFGQHRLSLRVVVTAGAGAEHAPRLGSPFTAVSPPPPGGSGGGSGGGGGAAPDPVVDAVGDMGCAPTDSNYMGGNGNPSAVPPANNCLQKSVSDLIVSPLPTALLDLGDNQYNNGELGNYKTVYNSTFGRANSVVYPSLGNAEYNTAGAAGFFGYFGQSTTVFSRLEADGGDNTNLTTGGYYSFNVGAHWHIIALNSNCAALTNPTPGLGGCGAGSLEEQWLKNDLANHPGMCTLAYWHHPLWNSGSLGNDHSSPTTGTNTAAFWTDLYAAHADIVLNGHGNHHYERFTPQNDSGAPAANGIREFIVSTGGQSHGVPPAKPGDAATSQITNYTSFGILQLTLHPTGYSYRFIPAVGSFTDSGSGTCHA